MRFLSYVPLEHGSFDMFDQGASGKREDLFCSHAINSFRETRYALPHVLFAGVKEGENIK